jgi:hypothetical protein
MRVNVYAEEITGDVVWTETTADTGKTYGGIRIVLESSPKLHHTLTDDDRSAVTIWGSPEKLRALLSKALLKVDSLKP